MSSSIDPARVIALVVGLAEKSAELEKSNALVCELREKIDELLQANQALQHKFETVCDDLDKGLPAALSKCHEYKRKYKTLREEHEKQASELQRKYSLLLETSNQVAQENIALTNSLKKNTVDFIHKLETSERTILAQKDEITQLQTTVETLQLNCQMLRQTPVSPQRAPTFTVSQFVEALAAVRDTSSQTTANVPSVDRDAQTDDLRSLDGPACINAKCAPLPPTDKQTFPSTTLNPSAMQFTMLRSNDHAMEEILLNGEILNRHSIERQIKIHDRVLATVANLQKEALKASSLIPPVPF